MLIVDQNKKLHNFVCCQKPSKIVHPQTHNMIYRSLKRVGGKWPHPYIGVDGDKFVCMDDFQSDDPCLVYSFGIANDWTFEDFITQFGCSVFAYDPSVKYPANRGDKIQFQQKGLADFFSPTMDTLSNYFKSNGHLEITVQYLKVFTKKDKLYPFLKILFVDRYRKP